MKIQSPTKSDDDVPFGYPAKPEPKESDWRKISPHRKDAITPQKSIENFKVRSNKTIEELDEDLMLALWTILAGEEEGFVYLVDLIIDPKQSDWKCPAEASTVPLA